MARCKRKGDVSIVHITLIYYGWLDHETRLHLTGQLGAPIWFHVFYNTGYCNRESSGLGMEECKIIHQESRIISCLYCKMPMHREVKWMTSCTFASTVDSFKKKKNINKEHQKPILQQID